MNFKRLFYQVKNWLYKKKYSKIDTSLEVYFLDETRALDYLSYMTVNRKVIQRNDEVKVGAFFFINKSLQHRLGSYIKENHVYLIGTGIKYLTKDDEVMRHTSSISTFFNNKIPTIKHQTHFRTYPLKVKDTKYIHPDEEFNEVMITMIYHHNGVIIPLHDRLFIYITKDNLCKHLTENNHLYFGDTLSLKK